MKHILLTATLLLALLGAVGCRGPKLSVADAQMSRGEYYDAAQTYRKIYNKLTKPQERTQRGEVAFRLGEAHRMLNQYSRSSAAYQNAIRHGYPEPIAQLRMAQMLHADGKYVPAARAYEEYLMQVPGSTEAQVGLDGAVLAQQLKARPTRYVVKNAKLFNSRRSDFAPQFNGSDILYFTTTNEKATGTTRSEITGMKRSDVWMARKDEQGRWQRPEAVEGELNTELDEGIVAFAPDGNTMYVTVARRSNSGNTGVEIFTSSRSDAQWSKPVKFDITADTVSSFGHPAVSPDGTYLYMSLIHN